MNKKLITIKQKIVPYFFNWQQLELIWLLKQSLFSWEMTELVSSRYLTLLQALFKTLVILKILASLY